MRQYPIKLGYLEVLLINKKIKKIMKKFILGGLFLSFLAISCKKDDNGGGTGSGAAYMTYDAGKQWNYEENNSGTITNYTLSATSNLEIKSGREYHVFTNSSDNSSEYYANSGSDYYTWSDLGMSGAQYENRYLIDNLPVNNTWNAGTVIINIDTTFNGLNASIDATILFRKKILDNNASLTLNSTNYLNVIHTTTTPEVVSVNLSVSGIGISGTTLDLSTSNFQSYYGKKYGVISDTSVLGGTLTIPAIPLLSLPITTVPLDNLINRITTLQSANF